MSTESTKLPITGEKTAEVEEAPASERPPVGEGIGVFRALLLTILAYATFGFIAWYAWHVFRHLHWHVH